MRLPTLGAEASISSEGEGDTAEDKEVCVQLWLSTQNL